MIRVVIDTNVFISAHEDNKFLVCAIEGQADYIVSGDKDLTDLKSYRGIQIISPAIFLDIIAKPQAN
ncbi:MAG: hypothetical protein C4567_13480 [Deltaproteobacteria bacterium]|nr:MAG: hypothetical protein C4567_13480 [Deltaproteobacteria bacterium]